MENPFATLICELCEGTVDVLFVDYSAGVAGCRQCTATSDNVIRMPTPLEKWYGSRLTIAMETVDKLQAAVTMLQEDPYGGETRTAVDELLSTLWDGAEENSEPPLAHTYMDAPLTTHDKDDIIPPISDPRWHSTS